MIEMNYIIFFGGFFFGAFAVYSSLMQKTIDEESK